MRTTRNENGDYTINDIVTLNEFEIDQLVKIRKEDLEKPKTMQIGQWYKSTVEYGSLIQYLGDKKVRGFFQSKDWNDEWCWLTIQLSKDLRPATEQEVKEALVAEAERRGYKNGNYLCLSSPNVTVDLKESELNKWDYDVNKNKLWQGGDSNANNVFKNGVWAEVVDVKKYTLSELEQIVGHKFEIV